MTEIIKDITIGVSIDYVNVLMLAAKVEAIKARSASMQATNKAREQRGDYVIYEREFAYCEGELENIAGQLTGVLKGMEDKAEQERKAGESDAPVPGSEQIEGPLAMTKDGVYPGKHSEGDGQEPKE